MLNSWIQGVLIIIRWCEQNGGTFRLVRLATVEGNPWRAEVYSEVVVVQSENMPTIRKALVSLGQKLETATTRCN